MNYQKIMIILCIQNNHRSFYNMKKYSFNKKVLSICILSSLYALPNAVQASEHIAELPTIVINATVDKSDELGQQHLAKNTPKDIKAVFDDIAGVNMVTTGRNQQIGDIEIRGMGGMSDVFGVGSSRVNMELDGMNISQSFNFGHNMSHGRQYFDTADLKQIQIQKGPSANGFAGNVKFKTKDPIDYLTQGKNFGGQVRAGYSGDSHDASTGVTLAFQPNSTHSGLLSYQYRQYNELNNRGGEKIDGANRTARNPLDGASHSINGKYIFKPSDQHKFSLALQHYQANNDTDYRNLLGVSINRRTGIHSETLNNSNEQKNQRTAIALNYENTQATPLYDQAELHLSAQHTRSKAQNDVVSRNLTTQQDSFTINNNDFNVDNFNFKANFEKAFGNDISHNLHYGVKLQYSTTELTAKDRNARTELVRNYFPKDKSLQAQFNIHDHIRFGQSGFSITPSLNVQHIQIKPELDVTAVNGTSKYNKTAVGGGIGLDYSLNHHRFSLSYNHQTRLPAYGETNGQYYGHWTGKPNPDLKPETAQSVEFNWKTQGELGYQQTTLFYNQYTDMINAQYSGFNDPSAELWLYNENGKTTGYGIEWSGKTHLDKLQLVDGLSLQGSFAYMNGKAYNGQKRAKIDPFHGSLSLSYDQPNEIWGLATQVKFSAAKKEKDLPEGLKGVKGYSVVNLTAYYNITPQLKLTTGLYNAFNKQYVPWNRVRGLTSDVNYNLYSEAGRYFAANLTYNF